jgi:hypothetical protein
VIHKGPRVVLRYLNLMSDHASVAHRSTCAPIAANSGIAERMDSASDRTIVDIGVERPAAIFTDHWVAWTRGVCILGQC